ncbi:MAG: HAD-IIIA family hydrolase, partial [Desulfobacteraceae bacterium]|nr:HAD-IIIA family hydrolase [Desulfobacteraceae bacterium]
MVKTIFLDRDGVINRDSPEYIRSRSEFEFLPTSLEAIRLLSQNNYQIIVITNQSAVARGMISVEELHAIHRMMYETVRRYGGEIQEVFC